MDSLIIKWQCQNLGSILLSVVMSSAPGPQTHGDDRALSWTSTDVMNGELLAKTSVHRKCVPQLPPPRCF